MFWLRYFYSCSKKATSICNKTGGSFLPMPGKWKLSLVVISTWHLKCKYRFYLNMFFDHPCYSHIVYMKLVDDISLLDFKIVVAKPLVGRYSNRNRSFCTTRLSKQKSHDSEYKRMRCHDCKNESSDFKSFMSCQACGLYLCLTKERNCFLKHHL